MTAAPSAPLAIVGPTASGKSALAMEIARRTGAELVSVDSMQVYRGMDIGTAKPTPAERDEVRHHLLDLLDPDEEASASWFQEQAREVLEDLDARGRPAILVGGTGLYHRAVVDGLTIPPRFPEIRQELEDEPDTAALHERLRSIDPEGATRMEPSNRRRIIRALEVGLGTGTPFSSFGPGLAVYPESPVLQVGLRVERPALRARIETRFAQQMDAGFLDEVRTLDARPQGWSRTAAQALGYRELLAHVRDARPLRECTDEAVLRTQRFAVRQDRWFRRDPRVVWLDVDAFDDVAAMAGEVLDRWLAA